MKKIIAALSTLALILVYSQTVQAEKVVVPLLSSSTSTVAAIPVYCDEANLVPSGDEKTLTCRRADTREAVTPVPEGHFLFVTDIIINRNSLASSGGGFIRIGNSNASEPVFDFTVAATALNHIKFSTPYLILKEGEGIRAANGDFVSKGGITMDVFVSGYMVKAESFGD